MSEAARALGVLREALPGAAGGGLVPVAPVVSPMCQAVDWACWRAEEAGLFLKLPLPEAAPFVSFAATVEATRAAAALGLGPALRWADEARGAFALDLLPPSWRAARLSDLEERDVLAAVLAARGALRAGPPLLRRWDVFERVEAMAAAAVGAGAAPPDLASLLEGVRAARGALEAAGRDLRPCHAGGLASDVMLGPGGAVMLVDFDCAGMADPHHDVGVLLNEAFALGDEGSAGLEMAFGRADPRDGNRCRLHAFADDVLWGLWGLATAAATARRELEFLKYGEWRLLRARMLHGDGAFDGRLRRL